MSLVAYGSSEEDTFSGDECATNNWPKSDGQPSPCNVGNSFQSLIATGDEDQDSQDRNCVVSSTCDLTVHDSEVLSSNSDLTENLRITPSTGCFSDRWVDSSKADVDSTDSSANSQPKSSLFASLPPPKRHTAAVEEPLDVVEIVDTALKPMPDHSGLLRKTGKGPVKIAIPSLSQFQDEPHPKRKLLSSSSPSASGLLQLLPAPKPSLPDKAPVLLVPEVLKRKLQTSSLVGTSMPEAVSSTCELDNELSTIVKNTTSEMTESVTVTLNKPESLKDVMVDFDEAKDSDDICDDPTPSDFFSLQKNVLEEPVDIACSDALQLEQEKPAVNVEPSQSPEMCEPVGSEQKFQNLVDSSLGVSDAPLNFKLGWLPPTKQQSSMQTFKSSTDTAVQSKYDSGNLSTAGEGSTEDQGSAQSIFTDERFLRLQGKKQRGKEDIHLIDISVDDQLPNSDEWLTKHLTEEVVRHPSRRRDGLPTQQQRRKHQITYLAFQAKERELELKNQWSQNRLTKRQTQAKYGF